MRTVQVEMRGTSAGDVCDDVAKRSDDMNSGLVVERWGGEKKSLLNQVPRGFQLISFQLGEAG